MASKRVWKALMAVMLAAPVVGLASPSWAASKACVVGIERAQAELDARLARSAAAGPFGRETTFATMGRQPTPSSVARAEKQLGDWPGAPKAVAALRQAREAQAVGNDRRCLSAVQSARNAIRQ